MRWSGREIAFIIGFVLAVIIVAALIPRTESLRTGLGPIGFWVMALAALVVLTVVLGGLGRHIHRLIAGRADKPE